MDDTQRKQEFLKTSIMDKGYDPSEFVSFLNEQRENGSQIDEWEYIELKAVVKMFVKQKQTQGFDPQGQQEQELEQQKEVEQVQNDIDLQRQQSDAEIQQQLHQNKTQQQQEQTQDQQQEQQQEQEQQKSRNSSIQEQQQQQKQEEKLNSQKSSQRNSETGEQTIFKGVSNKGFNLEKKLQCIKAPDTELQAGKDVSIHLKHFEKKAGGMFTSSYIIYKIKTYPFDWEVGRRYSDFYDLRNILLTLYPQLVIPPLPKKKNLKRFEPMFINKRMAILEKFLVKLIKNPELKACKFVQGFLKMTNEKDFKSLKSEGLKVKSPSKLEHFQSSSGLIDMKLNEDINNYCHRASEYFGQSDHIYKKIRQLSKQLFVDYDQLSTTLYNIGECFSQLYDTSSQFNAKIKEKTDKPLLLDDTYVTLNNMSVSWGNAINDQLKVIQDNFTYFFKYYNLEGKQIKDNLSHREHQHKKFMDYKKKLNDKKERLFTMGQTNQWDLPSNNKYPVEELKKNKNLAMQLMLPKETAIENDLREKSAFYSNEVYKETKRLLNEKVKEYSEHYVKFGHLQTDNIQEMHVMWADCMNNLEQLSQGGVKLNMLQKVQIDDIDISDTNQYE